jgi:transposase-like protein
MATSLAAAYRVPHTVKPPARCPHCGSTRLIRKGTRRKKLEIVQLWQCKLCRRVFTPAPAELRYKTYPLRIILDGVTLYNLGYSLPEAAAKLKSRHGYKVSPSTLASWMSEHRELTTYTPDDARPVALREVAEGPFYKPHQVTDTGDSSIVAHHRPSSRQNPPRVHSRFIRSPRAPL